jgi:hypothetical protein
VTTPKLFIRLFVTERGMPLQNTIFNLGLAYAVPEKAR